MVKNILSFMVIVFVILAFSNISNAVDLHITCSTAQKEEVKGNFDKAIKLYTQCIRLSKYISNKNLIFAYNHRGNIWESQKKYDKAIADFKNIVFLNPKDKTTRANIARLNNAIIHQASLD